MADLRLPNVNKVIISGRLTRDVEVRYTPAGTPVCTLPVALNRRYRGQDGEWKDDTTYVDVVAWERLADRAGQVGKKGAAVLVEGRLQSRNFETSEGARRKVIEVRAERIQFLDRQAREPEEAPALEENEGVGDKDMEDAGGEDDLPF